MMPLPEDGRRMVAISLTTFDWNEFNAHKASGGTIKDITVGLLQSFARVKPEDMKDLRDKFGTIIVDECHHIPAKTFRNVIAHLNPEYPYGLTATPKQQHNDEQLIYVYIGDIIANMADFADVDKPINRKKFDVVIRETNLNIPFNWKTDHFDLIAKVISQTPPTLSGVSDCNTARPNRGRYAIVGTDYGEAIRVQYSYSCRNEAQA